MSDENLDHGPVLDPRDIAWDQQQQANARTPDPRDVDETRRLLYGALAAGRTKRWELVGTLVNALVHHQGHPGDPYELLDRLVDVVESDVLAGERAGQWVRDLIAQLDTTSS